VNCTSADNLLKRCNPKIRLSREEERQLVAELHGRSRRRAAEARRQLVESQLPWLMVIVERSGRAGDDFDDLLQVACVALLECLETFDPARARLTTYCKVAVEWSLKNLRRGLIKRPRRPNPRWPEEWERAGQISGLTPDVCQQLLAPAESPYEVDLRLLLSPFVARLPSRTEFVFRQRSEGRTLAEIALDMGITKEAVRQHELKAIKLLRAAVAGLLPSQASQKSA